MNTLALFGDGPSRDFDRRQNGQVQRIQAAAELTHVMDAANAALAAAKINNIGNLVVIGKEVLKVAPEAAPYIGIILRSYASTETFL